jgi:hypothetical protein
MGVLGRRSRASDTADVAVARLRRGAHDVFDTVTDAAGELGDQVAAQVTAARRDLADRIDPDPVPRRGLRLLVLGLLVTTVSAVVWAVLARRTEAAWTDATATHGAPEHLPSTADPDDAMPAETTTETTAETDEPPATGLTGDPEARA